MSQLGHVLVIDGGDEPNDASVGELIESAQKH
jgi:regulator of RNase E activity RraA